MKITTELRRVIEATFPSNSRSQNGQHILDLVEKNPKAKRLVATIKAARASLEAAKSELRTKFGIDWCNFGDHGIHDLDQFKKAGGEMPDALLPARFALRNVAHLPKEEAVKWLRENGIEWE